MSPCSPVLPPLTHREAVTCGYLSGFVSARMRRGKGTLMHGLFSLGGALVLTLQLQAAAQPTAPTKLAIEGVGRAAIAIAFLHDSKNPMDPKVKSDLEASLGRSVADSLTGAHFQIAPT